MTDTLRQWPGAWECAPPGSQVYAASWARGEPARGVYADEELANWRRAAVAARRAGFRVWVVVHGGELPAWQIARGGWTDPDVAAAWGCWVERLGRTLVDQVDGWFALRDPLAEAAWYDRDARRVGGVLLHAQAIAWTQLRRGSGGNAVPVGALFTAPSAAFATRTWLDSAARGRLLPPWGIGGELGERGVLDVVGQVGAAPGAAGVRRVRVEPR